MIKVTGNPGLNVWGSVKELRERQAAGRKLAEKLFPGDAKWENRLINAAQMLSAERWELLTSVKKDMLEGIISFMMDRGFPADEPWHKSGIQPDATKVN